MKELLFRNHILVFPPPPIHQGEEKPCIQNQHNPMQSNHIINMKSGDVIRYLHSFSVHDRHH